jgi:hypothetical protein
VGVRPAAQPACGADGCRRAPTNTFRSNGVFSRGEWRLKGTISRWPWPPVTSRGSQDTHRHQHSKDGGGPVGDHVGSVETGCGGLRPRRRTDEKGGPAGPARATMAAACGPDADRGGGKAGRHRHGGFAHLPDGRRDKAAAVRSSAAAASSSTAVTRRLGSLPAIGAAAPSAAATSASSGGQPFSAADRFMSV